MIELTVLNFIEISKNSQTTKYDVINWNFSILLEFSKGNLYIIVFE
ncbi:hypothetical protein LEP1GSC166_1204 [Leptospira kirschneri]|nr:hypothetical protein LEP1GSC198_3070 [Leptospira kirschneri str. JB]EMK08691.1 hypothetical protein LEP1GSC166_1204 [Leptospira kirschneri]